MQIGEVARRAHTTTKALRYYEAIGLLVPDSRTPSGYRQYGPDALERLAFIRSAQALGFSLGEIRRIVGLRDRGETPCSHVLQLLRNRSSEIANRIADLQRMREELERLAEQGERLDPRDCLPSSVCHIIGSTRREPTAVTHRAVRGPSA
jgi:DNA-binding transcriptional MerR regulator